MCHGWGVIATPFPGICHERGSSPGPGEVRNPRRGRTLARRASPSAAAAGFLHQICWHAKGMPIAKSARNVIRHVSVRSFAKRLRVLMEIRFVSSLTAEDENLFAPALLKAVGALLDQLPIAYTIR